MFVVFFSRIVIYTSPFRKENKSPLEVTGSIVEKSTNIVFLKDFYLCAKGVSGASDQAITVLTADVVFGNQSFELKLYSASYNFKVSTIKC